MSLSHKDSSDQQQQTYEQRRAIRDDKRMNHYDRLQLKMQKERTKINSAPTIKKYEDKGDIRHESPPKTTQNVILGTNRSYPQKLNYHTYSLNHSIIPMNQKI